MDYTNTIFTRPEEKGSREWSIFSGASHDVTEMFQVTGPKTDASYNSDIALLRRFRNLGAQHPRTSAA